MCRCRMIKRRNVHSAMEFLTWEDRKMIAFSPQREIAMHGI
jgi:hypothetical protein